MLVQIVKDYKSSLNKYSPNEKMIWDGIIFSEKLEREADFVVVLNTPKKDIEVHCHPDNIVAIMQEPYHVEGGTDWMNSQLEQYHVIFTNHIPNVSPKNTKFIKSHGALPWHISKNYDELKRMDSVPRKIKEISVIASSLSRWEGHKERVEFINYLKVYNDLEIDFFGKGTNFIEDKWDGIAPYKYSIAIENTSIDDYWTEKISDVFLAYSLPFYFGCTNMDKYFPKESYIWIDISNPQKAIETMKEAIENNEYEKRLAYIEKARELVLDKYNLFPFIAEFIRTLPQQTTKKSISLKCYRYSWQEKLPQYIEKKKSRLKKIKSFFRRRDV